MPAIPSDDRSEQLHRIRAGFVAQGVTLHAWCAKNGLHYQNVRKAIMGTWVGPKATEVVARVLEASTGGTVR